MVSAFLFYLERRKRQKKENADHLLCCLFFIEKLNIDLLSLFEEKQREREKERERREAKKKTKKKKKKKKRTR